MKEKKDCKIVQDLLPNYIENLTNKETNNFIEEHLKECNGCQNILDSMKKELQVNNVKQDEREVKYIKKFSSKLKILKATIVLVLVIALVVMIYYYFYMRNAYIKSVETLIGMTTEGMYPDTFYATIEEIYDSGVYNLKSIKVKGLDINDQNHRGEYNFDIALDNIGDNFKIKFNGKNIPFESLKKGQKVAIYNYGNVDEAENNYLTQVRMIVVLDDEL